jgi:Holliday junction resolvasome RuvABC endonuclease subunit
VGITLGIDPGMKGGWAMLDDGQYVMGGRMPTKAYGKRRQVDTEAMFAQITCQQKVPHSWGPGKIEYLPPARVVVEMVFSSPQMGVVSAMSLGMAQGAALAIANRMCQQQEPVLVTPKVWKTAFALGSNKRDSLSLCAEYWPDDNNLWSVLANDGIAEAALMARWLDHTWTH